MVNDLFQNYIERICELIKQGGTREESFYNILHDFLSEFASRIVKRNIQITILPKKTEAGNPDFRVWDGRQHIVGYIEAKKPGEDLNKIEKSEQLLRYRGTFPNLILTDFFEFRLYRNGELSDKVSIGSPSITKKPKIDSLIENKEKFISLLEKFFAFSLPKVNTAKDLATELAKRTRFLRDEVISELEKESKEKESKKEGRREIYGFYEAFKQYLISDITQKDFADMYAQTITYGLFAARTRAEEEFTRKVAYALIPPTIGILRDIFQFISLGKVPTQMEVIIDDIAEVLQVTDVSKILQEYYNQGKGADPIVHFYETFLSVYDPETREKRGVYYTPEPVVKYIVRSVNSILKTHFDLNNGLASQEVTLLDPAAGTLTFPAEAIKLAVSEFIEQYGSGTKIDFIKNHILKNFYAFELMIAPYVIGHIKISFLLEELGYKLQEDDRFKLYLTNTLDLKDLAQTELPILSSLSEESRSAAKVKREEPILVIIGNPPYSGSSANRGEWIEKLLKEDIDGIQSYYKVDGKPLNEKKLWLQDDYVKFIRFAQWKINKTGKGVVGFITNHAYLDNPTFRGMRQSLMKTFNEIYILNLHGNVRKKEKAPDGSKDENVFDIQQGVAIAFFIKKENTNGCKVYYSELWGTREDKYRFLMSNDINSTKWTELSPKSEFYLFVPRKEEHFEFYQNFLKITDIFSESSTGIVTARDNFVIDGNRKILLERILNFRDELYSDEKLEEFGINKKKGWDIQGARESLKKDSNDELNKYILPILYRPFDIRYIFYHEKFIERPRKEFMKHMLAGENLGLITVRQVAEGIFNHAFVSENIIESRITLSNKGIGYFFPLYLYSSYSKSNLFDDDSGPRIERVSNIKSEIFDKLKKSYEKDVTPEQVFYYIYAVLYSNTYREKYAEFLKIDFPRIPFTKDYELFKKFAEFGRQLVELHLLKSDHLKEVSSRFEGEGEGLVEKVDYNETEKKIYINETQYFTSIEPEVWKYSIGGYQVLNKWLSDRKGRKLSMEDSITYIKIIEALKHTIKLQGEIDKHYTEIEEKLIDTFK